VLGAVRVIGESETMGFGDPGPPETDENGMGTAKNTPAGGL
jgi:hypothetical protein